MNEQQRAKTLRKVEALQRALACTTATLNSLATRVRMITRDLEALIEKLEADSEAARRMA